MKYNAYNLRNDGYRYLRGDSVYVEKAERYFKNGIIVPSGMAAISLLLQYLNPASIWYPYDLYQGTHELIDLLGIPFDDKKPDVVIYDNPSFAGNDASVIPVFSNKPVVIVDNSVMPDFAHEGQGWDYIVTSLSKYHTDCKTVLGLITVNDFCLDSVGKLKELRWKSGYVVFKEQCKALEKCYGKKFVRGGLDFGRYLADLHCKAVKVKDLLAGYSIVSVVSGSLVFVMVPDDVNPEAVARATPFDLRPTYGAGKTFCSYSYCDDNYRYFGNDSRLGKFIRIAVGPDMAEVVVANYVSGALSKFRRKNI